MKRAFIAVILTGLIAAPALSADPGAGQNGTNMTFEQKKAEILQHIDQRLSDSQSEKNCVRAASSHSDLKECRDRFMVGQSEGRRNMFMQGQSGGQGNAKMGPEANAQMRVPPQFAIDACIGKTDRAACTMSSPGGSRSGVCAYTPDGKYFACRPNDMPMQGQRGGDGRPAMGPARDRQ